MKSKEKELRRLDNAVLAFSIEMRRTLERKMHEGYTGWNRVADEGMIRERLDHHYCRVITDHDDMEQSCVHVANLCMMLHRFAAKRRLHAKKEAKARAAT